MSEHFNKLSPAQHERLSILMEEMAEAIQAIGQVLRHGYDDFSPYDDTKITNRRNLEIELGHVTYAVSQMVKHGDISQWSMYRFADHKASTAGQWLHHTEVL